MRNLCDMSSTTVYVCDCNVCGQPTMCDPYTHQFLVDHCDFSICSPCTPHICSPELPGDTWCDYCDADIPADTTHPFSLPLVR